MNRSTFLCIGALIVAFTSSAELQGPARPLSLDRYLDFEQVADPQISPDGARIIYVRRAVDTQHDTWRSTLWIMDADGTNNRPLPLPPNIIADPASAVWSPDGTRIAFVASAGSGGAQIFVRRMDVEGAVTQVTHVQENPGHLAWSPDGRAIAFTMLVPTHDKERAWRIDLPARPEGARWARDPRIIDRPVFRVNRLGFLKDGYRHVFVVPAAGGVPRQLTTGNADYGGGDGFGGCLSWTANSSEVVFGSLNPDELQYPWWSSDIFAVDVARGTMRQITKREGPDQYPLVSPDGRWIAYTGFDRTDDTYIVSKIYVVGVDGSNLRVISDSLDPYTSPYRGPQVSIAWAPDSSGVYFNPQERGTRNVYFASLKADIRQVTRGNHLLSLPHISRTGRAVSVATSHHNPGDVVTFDLQKPELTRLTAVNDDILADVKLGQVEEFWFTSLDDFRIQGWIVKPPDFSPSKKYPLMLSIHGGPHGMYGVGFNYEWQNHAAEGYVVVYTNPRGSSGYGAAFGNAIKDGYPGKDYDDLMKAVDEVLTRGYIDPRNMFVYGGSGGGVLTAWIVGHTDRFAAASANYPATEYMSLMGTTDGTSFYYSGLGTFKKMPWEDPSEHIRRSPLMYAGNVKTPTMLMTGELDLSTPISQTEMFYRALKLRGVPTAMLRFPDEWHGVTSRPSNFLRAQLYLRHWFARYMKKETPTDAARGGDRR
ncbi:MAG: prolyl oligopeptidase family serine peptidase [Vicinamibacterales bacterium]